MIHVIVEEEIVAIFEGAEESLWEVRNEWMASQIGNCPKSGEYEWNQRAKKLKLVNFFQYLIERGYRLIQGQLTSTHDMDATGVANWKDRNYAV